MHILILEDDPIIASEIADFAEQAGHTVTNCVGSVVEAIAEVNRAPVDLLVADVNLGRGGDGIAAAKRFDAAFGIKTVFLTGAADAAIRDRAQEAWPLSFLAKPVEFAMFARVLAMCEGLAGRPRPIFRPAPTRALGRRRSLHEGAVEDDQDTAA